MKDLLAHTIKENQNIREALEKLNNIPETLTLFVINNSDELVGTLTDGDIRRNLLIGKTLNDQVSDVMFTKFRFLRQENYDFEEWKQFKELKLKQIPLVDSDNKIIRLLDLNKIDSLLPLDAVIMAGGRGARLMPLTDTIPKPLLKVGDKTIIEHNIDRLAKVGIHDIYITIKYLGECISDHLGNGKSKGLNIHYITETEPMGTIGSVSKIKDFSHDFILVMNSDLLTNIDFEDFFKNFIEESADMSVASVPYNVMIPYAVLERDENKITSFKEKPTYTYYSNAGIYLIKRNLLGLIPIEKEFNATDFMEALINKGKKVIQFPILGYWLDIGKHEDYKKAQEDINHIKL